MSWPEQIEQELIKPAQRILIKVTEQAPWPMSINPTTNARIILEFLNFGI
ncbi:MAG: hypothetical protein OEY91_08625 [Nitrospirota bacterium]|nr:hypothetical protein [Nitrospirota bacterium]